MRKLLVLAALGASIAAADPVPARSSRDDAARHAPLVGAVARRVDFSWIAQCRVQMRTPSGRPAVMWSSQPTVGEGASACQVEDTAWVAMAYLKAWSAEHRRPAQDEARAAVRSLLVLQRPDGTWPSRVGAVAQPADAGADWRATARALQALGMAAKLLRDDDLAEEVRAVALRSAQRVQAYWQRPERAPGTYAVLGSQRVPQWLPSQRSDVAAALMLGFVDAADQELNDAVRDVVRTLGEGVLACQGRSAAEYPWGGFAVGGADPTDVLIDGGGPCAALALASERVGRASFLSAAMRGADASLSFSLAAAGSSSVDLCARAAQVIDAATLHRLTGRERYASLASLLAASMGRHGSRVEGAGGSPSPVTVAQEAARVVALLEAASLGPVQDLVEEEALGGLEPLSLWAAQGRAVSQEVARSTRQAPHGLLQVADLGPGDALWAAFSTSRSAPVRVDLTYWSEAESARAVDVRLDGQGIVECPLASALLPSAAGLLADTGTTPGARTLAAEIRAASRAQAVLPPGPHTVAVRLPAQSEGRRLGLARLVIQPTLLWRVWRRPDGRHLALVRSLSAREEVVMLAPAVAGGEAPYASGWDSAGERVTATFTSTPGTPLRLTCPPLASVTLEW